MPRTVEELVILQYQGLRQQYEPLVVDSQMLVSDLVVIIVVVVVIVVIVVVVTQRYDSIVGFCPGRGQYGQRQVLVENELVVGGVGNVPEPGDHSMSSTCTLCFDESVLTVHIVVDGHEDDKSVFKETRSVDEGTADHVNLGRHSVHDSHVLLKGLRQYIHTDTHRNNYF